MIAVTGAAGAYGGYVIQLAKADGLTVISDASEADEQLVKQLGVDIVVRRGEDVAVRASGAFSEWRGWPCRWRCPERVPRPAGRARRRGVYLCARLHWHRSTRHPVHHNVRAAIRRRVRETRSAAKTGGCRGPDASCSGQLPTGACGRRTSAAAGWGNARAACHTVLTDPRRFRPCRTPAPRLSVEGCGRPDGPAPRRTSAMNQIHILHENPAWLPPLADALNARGLPWAEWFMHHGAFDLAAPPPEGVFSHNRMRYTYTRDHRISVELTACRVADPLGAHCGEWSGPRWIWKSARCTICSAGGRGHPHAQNRHGRRP